MTNATVTIYSTQTCGYCKLAKEYLKANNYPYDEIDVGLDKEKAREMIEKSGQMGVPVITINKDGQEEVIVGYDKNRLASMLGLPA